MDGYRKMTIQTGETATIFIKVWGQ